jgi:hypothetical protein
MLCSPEALNHQLLLFPAGGEAPDVSEAPWFAADSSGSSSSSSAYDPSLLCGAPAFAVQQPPVTLQWLPTAEDFLQALTDMGCSMPAAAAAAASTPGGKRQQGRSSTTAAAAADGGATQGDYADANLSLLLGILRHVYRLGVQGRLQLKLGGGNPPKQLAVLLMALLLDPRAAGSAAGRGVLQEALAALLSAADELEWRRLQGQLLEALAPPGIGPSHRWGWWLLRCRLMHLCCRRCLVVLLGASSYGMGFAGAAAGCAGTTWALGPHSGGVGGWCCMKV